MILKFTCSSKMRLDEFLRHSLCEKIGDVSNSKIRRLILSGAVSVFGNQIRRPAYELKAGSLITVFFDREKFFLEKKPQDICFEVDEKSVLYEDSLVVVVNKPSFFPTEETIVGNEKRDNLHQAVIRYLWKKNPSLRNPPYAGIMHRLDRETSGAVLFTKARTANKMMHSQFENHTIKKLYIALSVCNKFNEEDFFSIENFLGRVSPKSKAGKWGSVAEENGGLYAKTDFRILKTGFYRGVRAALVEASPITGRTHQIRVHLSQNFMPIFGDSLYGGYECPRLMLHAEKLTFISPQNSCEITVKAPIPDIFKL